MAFVSFEFIIFVAAVFLVYFTAPLKYRWGVLLAASYAFYFISCRWLIAILFITTSITFFVAKYVGKAFHDRDNELVSNGGSLTKTERKELRSKAKTKAKRYMAAGVFAVLCFLAFLKYNNMLFKPVSLVTGKKLPELNLFLPLGISYYTLQSIAYIVDVYREKIKPEQKFLPFMLYMSYFPQIVQGPIPRYRQLADQLYSGHTFDYQRFAFGVQLILWGWMKKLILADLVSVPVNRIFNDYLQYKGPIVFFGALLYGIQVYADFSGGIDIARGVSGVIGIELERNFNQPYFSTSIEDFWRRWHITLGGWMRDYVFYPLSLSKLFNDLGQKCRKIFGVKFGKKVPPFLAMFIVYFLVGIWHGSSLKYIAYGIYNGIIIVMGIMLGESYTRWREMLKIPADSFLWRVFQILRTLFLVSIGRIFSRAYRLKAAVYMLKAMCFRWWDWTFMVDGSLKKLGAGTAEWFLILAGITILFAVDVLHERGLKIRESIAEQPVVFRWFIYYLALILVLLFGRYGPGYTGGSFIYERF